MVKYLPVEYCVKFHIHRVVSSQPESIQLRVIYVLVARSEFNNPQTLQSIIHCNSTLSIPVHQYNSIPADSSLTFPFFIGGFNCPPLVLRVILQVYHYAYLIILHKQRFYSMTSLF